MIDKFGRSHTGGKALPLQELLCFFLIRRAALCRVGAAVQEVLAPPSEALSPGLVSALPRLASLRWSPLEGAHRGFGWSSCPIWGMWRSDGKGTHIGRFISGTKIRVDTSSAGKLGGTERKWRRTLQVQDRTKESFVQRLCSVLLYCVLSCQSILKWFLTLTLF